MLLWGQGKSDLYSKCEHLGTQPSHAVLDRDLTGFELYKNLSI